MTELLVVPVEVPLIKALIQMSSKLTPEQQEEREKIIAENKLLRKQIKMLENMEGCISHNKTLKIVGEGAKDFEEVLLALNMELKKIQKEK